MVVLFYFYDMHTVYIIYSDFLDKYYIGESIDAHERLNEHNGGFYQRAFTKITQDWKIKLILECKDKQHAKRVENHIKQMKSRVFIENLIKYKEMQQKLIQKHE